MITAVKRIAVYDESNDQNKLVSRLFDSIVKVYIVSLVLHVLQGVLKTSVSLKSSSYLIFLFFDRVGNPVAIVKFCNKSR